MVAKLLRFGAAALLLIATASLVACESWLSILEPDPDTISIDEIILVRRAGGTLPLRADGISNDTIIAEIPLKARSRLVRFTTTAGSFALTRAERQIDVRAILAAPGADRLTARAVLISDTTPGVAVVRGAIGEFSNFTTVPFER